jgi:protein O-GlcNAc transferase
MINQKGFGSPSPINPNVKKSKPDSQSQQEYLQHALALAAQYYQTGNSQRAKAIYEQILQSHPNHAQALRCLGLICAQQGENERAIQYLAKATQLNPTWDDVYYNLGNLFKAQGNLKLAVQSYQAALTLNPSDGRTAYNLAGVAVSLGNSVAAVENYLYALECGRNLLKQNYFTEARSAVDYCYQFANEQQKIRSAIERMNVYMVSGLQSKAYEQFLEIESQILQNPESLTPSDILFLYKYFFYLPYLRDNIQANSNLYKVVGQLYVKKYVKIPEVSSIPAISSHQTSAEVKEAQPLRIGILSNYLHRHSIGWCSVDTISELSKLTPNLYIYYTQESHQDDLTQRFQQTTPNFFFWAQEYPNQPFNENILLEQLIFDKLDVLIDLDSVMHWRQISVLPQHPAPICLTWLGYEAPYLSPHNYYLGDWNTHPSGIESNYTEQLLRMPNAHIAVGGFSAESSDRETIRKSLNVDDNQIVYFCVAPVTKVNTDLIKAQISILQQVENSILVYKSGSGDTEAIKAMYEQESEAQGVSKNRLRFLKHTPTEEAHRSIYQGIDIALDSYPYNGGTHNLETLWFNVPLVTRVGEIGPSRMGYSFLKTVGIEEGIAHNWEEYITWGVRLGQDASLRENIRNRLIESKQPEHLSPLWNPKQFAVDLYHLLAELITQVTRRAVEAGGAPLSESQKSKVKSQKYDSLTPSLPHSLTPSLPHSLTPVSQDEGNRQQTAFLNQLVANVTNSTQQYLQHPSPEQVQALRQYREEFIEYILHLPDEEVKKILSTETGRLHLTFLYSAINHQPLTQAEEESLAKLSNLITQEQNSLNVARYLLACMLYRPAERLPILHNINFSDIDSWFLKYYMIYLFGVPFTFEEIGQVEQYAQHICHWVNSIHTNLFNNPQSESWRKIAWLFVKKSNFPQLCFSDINMKDVCCQRSELTEFVLENSGAVLNYTPLPGDGNPRRIRLGILCMNFNPHTEAFATLPVFEDIDKNEFEIFVYVFQTTRTPFEQTVKSCAEHFNVLPPSRKEQVEAIRSHNLDILFFGGNLTTVTNQLYYLAHHRLAPVQVTSICSPCTTGIRNIDYYIAGELLAPVETAQNEYRETLLNIPGSGICFSTPTQEKSQVKITRSNLGISKKQTVFISGANSNKIIPEVREAWAKIIAAVPNSVLLLYPFNPNLSRTYPEGYIKVQMYTAFEKHNIDKSRLIFLPPVANPSDINEYLRLANIYLDSFPYGEVTSLVDALKMNLSCVVYEGSALRFRQTSAVLKELEMPDLVTKDVDSYMNLAVTLGTNLIYRIQKEQEIKLKMHENPNFLNNQAYSAELQTLFRQLHLQR